MSVTWLANTRAEHLQSSGHNDAEQSFILAMRFTTSAVARTCAKDPQEPAALSIDLGGPERERAFSTKTVTNSNARPQGSDARATFALEVPRSRPRLAVYRWREMPKVKGSEPTQETTPTKGGPVEIPIPTREEVFRDLENVAKPRQTPPPSD